MDSHARRYEATTDATWGFAVVSDVAAWGAEDYFSFLYNRSIAQDQKTSCRVFIMFMAVLEQVFLFLLHVIWRRLLA